MHVEVQRKGRQDAAVNEKRGLFVAENQISRGLSRTMAIGNLTKEIRPASFATHRSQRKDLLVDFGVAGAHPYRPPPGKKTLCGAGNEVDFSEAFYPGRPYTHEEDIRYEELEQAEIQGKMHAM